MTHALGTTLTDIEAKAERKREAEKALQRIYDSAEGYMHLHDDYETIRKYIEDN